MKIFISWSKVRSNKVALLVKKLITDVFDNEKKQLDFFISSEDIYAGEDWFKRITAEIESSDLAIICLTRENKYSKWLDFESGAMAFNSKKAIVCPYLIDFGKLNEGNPLKSFQVTRNTKADLFRLIKTIRNKTDYDFSNKQLEAIFNEPYEEFSNQVSEVLKTVKSEIDIEQVYTNIYPTNVRHVVDEKIFIGCPMASIDSDSYPAIRNDIMSIIQVLKDDCSFSEIYSPVIDCEDSTQFDGKETSIEVDFAELKKVNITFLFIRRKCHQVF